MKEKFLKIQFLVYAVLLFVAAAMLESMLGGFGSLKIDPDKVQAALHEKERTLDGILSDMRDDAENGGKFVKENSVWMYDRDLEYLKDDGFAVFIYESDTLRYWSDNSVSLDKLFSKTGINNTMHSLANGWYEIRTLKSGNTLYLGLILIKNEYKHSNKYLVNNFGPGFGLDPSLRVALMPMSYGIDITDSRGDYIFTIVPTNSIDLDNSRSNIAGVLFLLSLAMLMLYIKSIIASLTAEEGNSAKIIGIIALVVAARIMFRMLKIPANVYSLDFFDPVYFADDSIFSTIGDFITNMTVLLFLLHYVSLLAEYMKFKEWIDNNTTTGKYLTWAAMVAVYFLVFGYLYAVTRRLVGESQISFQLTNVMTLDIFSFSGIMVMSLLTATIIYAAVSMARYFDYSPITNLRRSLLVYLGAAVLLSAIVWAVSNLLAGLGVMCALLMLGTAMYMTYRDTEPTVYKYIFMLFICAMFSCALIIVTGEEKADKQCSELASSPSDYGDPVAELLLAGISEDIGKDEIVPDYINPADSNKMYDYLLHQYFNGYWTRYYLNVKILESSNGNFSDIADPFVKAVNTRGAIVNTTAFYLVANNDGAISYYAPFKYNINGQWYFVCVALDRKPVPQEIGYPSLLIDSKVKPSEVEGYDYVRYHRGSKVSQNGNFSYDMTDRVFEHGFEGTDDTIRIMKFDGYVHTVYHKGDNTVAISRKQVTFVDYVVQLAYLFMIYIVWMMVYMIIDKLVHRDYKFRYQIKTKLILSITLIMLLAFVSICAGTVYLNIVKFRAQNNKGMEEKVSSVYVQLEQLCGDTLEFSSRWAPTKVRKMDEILTNMSHVFFTDVNLYGVDGEMIACSRPEIFRDGLISSRINRTAFQRFIIDRKSAFSHEEHIGRMSFASAYIPFYNNSEKLVGYINLPYFTKPEELERELSTIIVSILNLYVVLMMISIMTGVIISERIVQPIKLIQSKMETIELGKNYEKIDYDRKDEVGQLVTEYNNMVEKLDESAKLLAKGERESAWREMAKQIAHEIKNPLTPMKLSIQFLTRSWKAKNPDFENVLERVSSTLIQQIDTLSSIATGFSNFAKLPQPDAKPLNIVEVIDNVVLLYHTVENADITSDMGGHKEVIVMADKEQMTRVFVNIIKNATQAIPEGVRGKIHVSLEVGDEKITARIADNGCGIPDEIREKLFTPNFTTKSSGSGLGLAMVKNMVINAKGEITFESEVGKGTTFIITLPKARV